MADEARLIEEARKQREARADTCAGRNRFVVGALAGLLRFDELFSRWALGRGIVLCARRGD